MALHAERISSPRETVVLPGSIDAQAVVSTGTLQLLHAASELVPLIPYSDATPLAHERIDQFLDLYRNWIIRERGLDDAPAVWAERSAILLHLMAGGGTLLEAIEILVRFGETVWGPQGQFKLYLRDKDAILVFGMLPASGPEGVLHSLWPITITLSQLEFLAGTRLEGASGQIMNPPDLPPHLTSLFFRAPITYEAEETALILPISELQRAVTVRSAEVPEFMRNLLASTIGVHRHSPALRTLIAKLLWQHWAQVLTSTTTMSSIARQLNLSVATVRRRLQREGTTFRRVKDDVCDQIAKTWLRDQTQTVEQIAERLGYSDAHSFRRAFHRTNGLPPRSYRSRTGAGM